MYPVLLPNISHKNLLLFYVLHCFLVLPISSFFSPVFYSFFNLLCVTQFSIDTYFPSGIIIHTFFAFQFFISKLFKDIFFLVKKKEIEREKNASEVFVKKLYFIEEKTPFTYAPFGMSDNLDLIRIRIPHDDVYYRMAILSNNCCWCYPQQLLLC